MRRKNKLLIIYGPTASGKTSLALDLASIFHGELISADSRQVYKGMDIITGKDLPQNLKNKKSAIKYNNKYLKYYLFGDIPVWGLDLLDPNEDFSVAHWLEYTKLVINDIYQRGKLPIIVGGTAFWLNALIKKPQSIGVKPDPKLRLQLQKKSTQDLYNLLSNLDAKKASSLNQSDQHNPRRLIRAIELIKTNKKKKTKSSKTENSILFNFDMFKICLNSDIKHIENLINKRIRERIRNGGLAEIKTLKQKGYSFDLPSMTACGYLAFKNYFAHKKSLDECLKDWYYSERSYAKRQKLWFSKDRTFNKVNICQKDWQKNLARRIKNWYDN